MVRLVRTRHRRDAVSLLLVRVGCCHFIYPFLFGCYFVSIGKKLNTEERPIARRRFVVPLIKQRVEGFKNERFIFRFNRLIHFVLLILALRINCMFTRRVMWKRQQRQYGRR